MTPPLDKASPAEPSLTNDDERWLDGFESFTERYVAQNPAAFQRSSERRALYGDDRERELADLEAGKHPLLLR